MITRDLGRKRPLKNDPQPLQRFGRNIAIIIGVQSYQNGIPPLNTPINDGQKLASLLENNFGYRSYFLKDGTKNAIQTLLTERLPQTIRPDDRLIFYFAGHGVAQESDSGPNGYMVPVDGHPLHPETTYLAMYDVNHWLESLPCRHLLVILDCCFAGTFRWSGTRRVPQLPEIQRERYERFVSGVARQVLTSTTQSEEALDVFGIGRRGEATGQHSPFATALIRGLEMGEADLALNGKTDGLITATELYFYLEQEVAHAAQTQSAHRQTPRLWPLAKHGSGEFVFETPAFNYDALEPAPELTFENNPYRGLNPFQQQDAPLFFGRDAEIAALKQLLEQSVAAQTEGQVIIVTGPSGSGKTSLVQAGLLPALSEPWVILGPTQPGREPLTKFADLFAQWEAENGRFTQSTSAQYLLVINNLERINMASDGNLIRPFFQLLGEKRRQYNGRLHILFTIRHDFLDQLPLRADVPYIHRYHTPPMHQDSLRAVIENPAAQRMLHFDPPELINTLINEVNQTPGALALLSYTLSEMYKKHLLAQRHDRALTQADYDAVGGVTGALRKNIAEVYADLPDAAHQRTMKHLLLRLIYTWDIAHSRRQVSRAELDFPQAAENERVRTVIKRLAERGLLVAGTRIELAHDALFTVWGQFATWQKEAADYLPLQRRLWRAAKEWQSADKARHRQRLLWDRSPHLHQLHNVLKSNDNWLNRQETAFVKASWAKYRWDRNVGLLLVMTSLLVLLLVGYIGVRITNLNENQRLAEERAQVAQVEAENADKLRQAAEAQLTDTTAEITSHLEQLRRSETMWQATFAELNETVAKLEAANTQLTAARQALENVRELIATESGTAVDPATNELLANLDSEITRVTAQLAQGQSVATLTNTMFQQLNKRFAPFASPDLVQYEQAFLLLVQVVQATLNGQADIPYGKLGDEVRTFFNNLPPHFQHLRGHEAGVDYVAFAPDGQTVASASWEDGTIRLWRLSEGVPGDPVVLSGSASFVGSLAFSPEGRWLATAVSDGTIKLWDLTTSDPSHNPLTLGQHATWVTAVSFSPDGRWLASAARDGSIRLWDMAASDPNRQPRQLSGHDNWVTDLSFAPDGQTLASASWDQTVRLWDVATASRSQPLATLRGHAGVVSAVAFTPDGQTLASASWDSTVRLWELATTPTTAHILENYFGDGVDDLIFSHDGNRLAYTGTDNRVYLWPLPIGAEAPITLDQHRRDVTAIAFAPDDQTLVSTSSDRKIRLWDLAADSEKLTVLHGHEREITAVSFAPDGQTLATVSLDNSVRLWDLTPPPSIQPIVLASANGGITDIAFAGALSQTLTVVTNNQLVEQWDLALPDSPAPTTLWEAGESTTAAIVSPQGNWLATTAGADIELRSVNGGEKWELTAGETAVLDLAFAADETVLAVLTEEQAIWWDLTAVSPQKRPPIPIDKPASTLAISADGQRIAFASQTTIALWADDTAELVWLETKHADPILQLAFSPDGQRLASGSADGLVQLWDVAETAVVPWPNLARHDSSVVALAFAPDNTTLATAAANSVYLWQVRANDKPLQPIQLTGHEDRVWAVAFTPDGQTVASAGADGTVRLWPTLPKMIEIACQTVTRNFSWHEWQLFMPGQPYATSCENLPIHETVRTVEP